MADKNLLKKIISQNSNVSSKHINPILEETEEDVQKSQNFQDCEINAELEELINKIHSEIAKREESNLKHNILYIPPLEENKKEELSKELILLKERIITVANLHISCNNYNNYGKGDGEEMPIVLKSLLENKLNITKKILNLTCLEDILKSKVKFQENLDSIVFDLNADYKDLSENIAFYRQQWRQVVTELNELKNLQTSLDIKIKSIMLDSNVSENDYDFLKHTIELKTIHCDFQAKHINYLKEAFREEVNVKDKFIHIMAQMLDMYKNILRRHSLLTEQMSDSYGNMIRTAQVLGMNTLMVDEPVVSNVPSQDSGIFNEYN